MLLLAIGHQAPWPMATWPPWPMVFTWETIDPHLCQSKLSDSFSRSSTGTDTSRWQKVRKKIKKTGVASCHWQHTYYVKHTKGSPKGPNHTGYTHTWIENHPLLPKSGSLMDKTISHNRDSKTHQHLLFAWEYLKKLTRRRTKSWMVTFQWLRCLDWDSVHIGTIF